MKKLVFTFINGSGETRKVEADNITTAWVKLSFDENLEVEELVERGWQVKFK